MAKYLDVFVVTKFMSQGQERSRWIRVGAAFPHRDGKGFNMVLDCVPVNGELTVREPRAQTEQRSIPQGEPMLEPPPF